jgi:uncharacterized RDD family membrane protein YckC
MTILDSPRAGFWRRFVAIIIDVILILAIVIVAGVWLANTTDGRVRVASSLGGTRNCTILQSVPAEVRLPQDFKITSVMRCTNSLRGFEHNWTLNLIEATQTGPSTWSTRTIVLPLDPTGRIASTSPFYLDTLIVFLFAAYLLGLEFLLGATAGQFLLGIRVRSLDGGSMDFAQGSKRLLMRMIPLLPFMLYVVLVPMHSDVLFLGVSFSLITAVATALLMITFLVNFIKTTSQRALPWHDRWARTEAVRVDPVTSSKA